MSACAAHGKPCSALLASIECNTRWSSDSLRPPLNSLKMSCGLRIFTLLMVGSTLASCGGGGPNSTGPDPDDPQMVRVIKPNPSFAVDIQEIFVRTGCTDSGCHRDGQAGFFLVANDTANHANIVNVPAEREREFFLIEPLDAANSYIMIRLENRQAVGVPMPPGFVLDDIDLTNLRNWINNGAPDS